MLRTTTIARSVDGESPVSNRGRFGWYLFDFANSILIINGSLYFPQWIVGPENGVSDLWFNLIFVVSSLALLATAPWFGFIADQRKHQYRFLLYSSSTLVLSGIAVGLAPTIPDQDIRVLFVLISFFVVLYSYQLSTVFYNALLASVSDPQHYVQVSGRALAWGWIGGIIAVFFGLLFTQGYVPSIGSSGGMGSVFPSAIVTAVLTATSLYLLRKYIVKSHQGSSAQHIEFQNSLSQELRSLPKNRTVWFFLLSYLCFSDAILTLQNNSTIYMDAVLGFSDDVKAYQFLLVLLTAAIGALACGSLVKRFGLSGTLRILLMGWAITVVVSSLTTDPILFTVSFAMIGLLNGAVWNVARVLFLTLIPVRRYNTYFGVYSSFERFASILGPLIWGLSVTLFASFGIRTMQIK